MMNRDVIVVGGGPAGIITALTAKSVYPEKSVCLIKDIGEGVIPCAIPYMMNTLKDPAQNKMGNQPLEQAGVEIIVDRVTSLAPAEKAIDLNGGSRLTYDRLVLATGMTPFKPSVPGIDLAGVHVIEKSLTAMQSLRMEAQKAQRVVILGGGFIGAEFAEEFVRQLNTQVHIVEMMPKLLYTAFDDEFCDAIQAKMVDLGVHVHTGRKAVSINGSHHVESVSMDNGEDIPADLVIIGIGGRPYTALAEQAGFKITDGGSIWVDAYMRTSVDDVFAVGDCALKRDFFTRREAPVWLASTATAEARIAGTNLFGIRVLRQIQGTISAFSTRLGDTAFASSGLTCRACQKEGFRVVTGMVAAPDRHPGTLPGAQEMRVKLVFADRAGTLLGGQVSGGPSVGELINTIAIGIQLKLNVRDLDMIQIATHPLLTSAPTVHPLINAAHQALAKLRTGRAG
jgi:NADH oxidase (H2O2-forming)